MNQQKSIAKTLKEKAEYHTAMLGKWHLGVKLPINDNSSYPYRVVDSRTHITKSAEEWA